MYLADELRHDTVEIDGMWVIAKPYTLPFYLRLIGAWKVLTGKDVAVHFYKQ